MKRKATALTAIVAILFCFCAAASAEETGTPAAAPAAGEATDPGPSTMVEWIVAIRSAKDVATAATSYAKARMLDKNDVELYDTYMKKMLTFGHPKIAAYPAMELRRLQAKNGTAWGVLGYNDAKRGKYLQALMSTIQGMTLLPADPGIQNNAGILLAWYETRPLKPRLSVTLQALLKEHSQQWLDKPKYADAHSTSKSDFAVKVQRMEKMKAELVPAEKAAKAAARISNLAADKYRQYARAIGSIESNTRELERKYAKLSRDHAAAYYCTPYHLPMSQTRSKISANKSRLYSLRSSGSSLRSYAVKKTELYKETKNTLDKAKAALKAEERIRLSLTWMPPAVDGVITPEGEKPPKFTIRTGSTTKSSASAADVQLKMAKLLILNKRMQKAKMILESIIKKYPDSKAAKEAAKLLKGISTGLGDL